MTIRCVVLDFDGTLTDADRHAAVFHERSRQELARQMQWDEATARGAWSEAQAWVAGLPDHAGWNIDGSIICPAHADPYLSANSIVRRVVQERHPALDETEVLELVFRVHRASYLAVLPEFRSDAASVVQALLQRVETVSVVTNSHPVTVASLLDRLELRDRARLRVAGHAGKFWVCPAERPDARFDALPRAAAFPGIDREVLVRRGKYFDVLRTIWDQTDTGPQETLVAGDIFELDLAMPSALGARVHLVLRAGTLRSERTAAALVPAGGCSELLQAVLARIED